MPRHMRDARHINGLHLRARCLQAEHLVKRFEFRAVQGALDLENLF